MVYLGTAVSAGIAFGKAHNYSPYKPNATEKRISPDEIASQLAVFAHAVQSAERELTDICDNSDTEKAAIFGAQKLILQDEEILEEVRLAISDDEQSAAWAVQRVYSEFADLLAAGDDPLIRERADDLRDIKNRILRCVEGLPEQTLSALSSPCVLIAEDLYPSDTVSMDSKMILAILTEKGGATSHTAILARSSGIPAVLGIPGCKKLFAEGANLIVDAVAGKVILEPTPEDYILYKDRKESLELDKRETEKYAHHESKTRDGTKIFIETNIGSVGSDSLSISSFVDGSGLFRTEFLFMESWALPTEEQQLDAYKQALLHFNGKPVVLRTLDIGGDKQLRCMELPKEDNPFLGRRALRLSLSMEDVFQTQLRAALRASAFGDLRIMFPMVGSLDDIEKAKSALEKAKESLAGDHIPYNRQVKVGVMIEIPSLALIADKVAECVDFASIGTNDLCQYLTAADRLNPQVSDYYQSFHPAMFRLIAAVADSFDKVGKPLCVCGELGGIPESALAFIGLGIRELSMSPSCVAEIKRLISHIDVEEARETAKKILKMSTDKEIKTFLKSRVTELLHQQPL